MSLFRRLASSLECELRQSAADSPVIPPMYIPPYLWGQEQEQDTGYMYNNFFNLFKRAKA